MMLGAIQRSKLYSTSTTVEMSTTIARLSRPKKASRFLTPLQLAELKKGSKTALLVGPARNHFIAIEGVSINLLAHFSPYAKEKLIEAQHHLLHFVWIEAAYSLDTEIYAGW
jgi:hypothetical protein